MSVWSRPSHTFTHPRCDTSLRLRWPTLIGANVLRLSVRPRNSPTAQRPLLDRETVRAPLRD
jgi:hypothetical protein